MQKNKDFSAKFYSFSHKYALHEDFFHINLHPYLHMWCILQHKIHFLLCVTIHRFESHCLSPFLLRMWSIYPPAAFIAKGTSYRWRTLGSTPSPLQSKTGPKIIFPYSMDWEKVDRFTESSCGKMSSFLVLESWEWGHWATYHLGQFKWSSGVIGIFPTCSSRRWGPEIIWP